MDRSGETNLQAQLRAKVASAIADGALRPGTRLPATRQLATELGVARNTVALAYQQLVSEGLLVSRERSGIFVNDLPDRVRHGIAKATPLPSVAHSSWTSRIRNPLPGPDEARLPPNWAQYPYPFLDGRFDPTLFPIDEWREANRLAVGRKDVTAWSTDSGEADDPLLIEEIRTKVLPPRGIFAKPDEILITVGAQHALSLIVDLLADGTTTAMVEEPGYPDLRTMLTNRGATLRAQPIDAEGLVVDGALARADLVFVTAGHQFPTGAVMGEGRRRDLLDAAERHDVVVVEDDVGAETSYLDQPPPAVKALDESGQRVIYLSSLGRVLAPGLRLGFIVAPTVVISQLRLLRRLAIRHPPLHNQRSMAFFLSLGHYEAMLGRLGRVLRERRTALRDAINHYMRIAIDIQPMRGGATFWVTGSEGFDADVVVRDAAQRGILVEATDRYFLHTPDRINAFRMGVTSIPTAKIRPGVETLARVIRDRLSPPRGETRRLLSGREIKATLSGRRLLYRTVYGDPCTIDLDADGTMTGAAGYANEDRDSGRWWIEGDLWCRQWQGWAYGEPGRYQTAIEADQIAWFNPEGLFVDSAVIAH